MSSFKPLAIAVALVVGATAASATETNAPGGLKGDPFDIGIPTKPRSADPAKDVKAGEGRTCRFGLCYPDFPVPRPQPTRLMSGALGSAVA